MVASAGQYSLDCVQPVLPEDGSTWIAPTAALIGRVTLGEGVSVWFGAVIRGDDERITVGAFSNVQDGAVLHADPDLPLVIGRYVTIGHNATLHGCIIGDNVLVGMGACIMNGAKIGNNCVIGAGALVTEGKEFPDGSLILGAPAKLVGGITADATKLIVDNAELYVGKARRYAAGLSALPS